MYRLANAIFYAGERVCAVFVSNLIRFDQVMFWVRLQVGGRTSEAQCLNRLALDWSLHSALSTRKELWRHCVRLGCKSGRI